MSPGAQAGGVQGALVPVGVNATSTHIHRACLGAQVYVHFSILDAENDLLYTTWAEEGGSGQPLAFVVGKGCRAPRAWELAVLGERDPTLQQAHLKHQLLEQQQDQQQYQEYCRLEDRQVTCQAGQWQRAVPPCGMAVCVPCPQSERPCCPCTPVAPADMTHNMRKQLKVQPSYGYKHPDCSMQPPPGVEPDQVLQFVMQLCSWYPAKQVRRS